MRKLLSWRQQLARAASHGFVVGVLASSCLVAERVSAGATSLVTLALIVTLAVLAQVVWRLRRLGDALPLATPVTAVSGVLLGVLLTHAVVALGGFVGPSLDESPPQLVNDLMFGGGLMLLAWSVVAPRAIGRIGAALTVLALALAYRATGAHWHLDAIDFPQHTIQQLVVMQLVAIAVGLTVLDWFLPRRARGSLR